jgi:hypothetical protein
MLWRIFIAGIVGGILAFVMGAVCHAVLQLQSRTLARIPDEPAFIEHIRGRNLNPGLYSFPEMAKEAADQDMAKAYAGVNEKYRAGPAGLLLTAPTGEDMMSPKTLGLEWATNTAAAFLAAWLVSLFGADVGFVRRWLAVVVIGVVSWLSIAASYGIWYRFPHNFIHDELYCALIEWAVAGIAIAAIVRRPTLAATTSARPAA